MNWIQVSIETTSAAVDAVCSKIIALGIEGMQIEDSSEFQEFLENKNESWDFVDEALIEQKKASTAVIVYLSDTPEGHDTLSALRTEIAYLPSQLPETDFGSLNISLNSVQDSDWEESWKQYYKVTPIGKKLLVVPEWEPVPETDRAVFINNPGMSFGTGTHASTRLALEFLEKHIEVGDTLLDLGCGSGILSICGLLMGAKSATAVDIDANAVQVAVENTQRNNISPERLTTYAGNVLTDKKLIQRILYSGGISRDSSCNDTACDDSAENSNCSNNSNSSSMQYRIVLANIVADVILELPPLVAASMKKEGGVFISSGIIEPRLHEVENGLKESGMKILETKTSEGWCVIAAQLQ